MPSEVFPILYPNIRITSNHFCRNTDILHRKVNKNNNVPNEYFFIRFQSSGFNDNLEKK